MKQMEGKSVRRKNNSSESSSKGGEKQPRYVSDSSRPLSSFHCPEDNRSDMKFWAVFGASQAVGITMIGLVIHWCKLYGGFSWTNANLQFYYHPVFMILGLVFFYGDAIIIYRVLDFLPKTLLKVVHAGLHMCAIIFATTGLVAVLEYHRRTNKPDFYSLHSWIGISTFGLFCFQYIGGFVSFLYPGLPADWRARAMPFHTFFGSGLFVLAIASAETGFTEKLIWTRGYTEATFNEQALIGNILGLALIVFGFLIIFIVTHAAYKRKPLPGELPNANVN